MGSYAVRRNAEDQRLGFFELIVQRRKIQAFLGTAGGVVARIEVNDQRTAYHVLERPSSVRALEGELRRFLADLNLAHALTLYWFENGIQIQVIAKIHELFAQYANMQATRHVHDHLNGKHRSAGMRSRIGARRKFGDVDAALREKSGESGHYAGLVEAHHVDGVGQHIIARGPLFGAPQLDIHAGGVGQLLELTLELGKGVPIAVEQEQHRKLVAERGHATFADAPAAISDGFG